MAFKRPIDGRKALMKKGVRVKGSYYTFSKEYPVGNIGGHRKIDRKKRNKAIRLRVILSVVCFTLLLTAAYFVVDLGLKFSYKDISDKTTEITDTVDGEATASVFSEKGVKALYMPSEKLDDEKYIRNMIRQIKIKDADSVVVDFKTRDGHTVYSSYSDYAILGKCAMFDNETVRKAISLFEGNDINVIAGIYCFEDPIISAANSNLAVKYMDTDVTWLDKPSEEGGKPWLNPYSKKVCGYIRQIISEVNSMGIKGFILKSVSFPDGEATDTAGYPGEKKKSQRTDTLLSFIESVKASLPRDCFVLVAQSASDALNGNEKLYFGSISQNAADGVCADTAARPEVYTVDKSTDFSSMMSLFANIGQSVGSNSRLVPIIGMDEYSRKYIKTIVRSGYTSYILYDENGEY